MNEPAPKSQLSAPEGSRPLPPPPVAPLPSEDMIKTTQYQAADVVAEVASTRARPAAGSPPPAPLMRSTRVPPEKPRWPILVKTHVAKAVSHGASRLRSAQAPALSRSEVGVACGVAGGAMILAAIVFGWVGVLAPTLDRFGAAASAVVMARAGVAIATMATGAWLVAMGERFSRSSER